MSLDDIKKISSDAEQVQLIYQMFDENARLNRSKAARVEFITTVKYIERYLKKGDRILDIGAGAGEYSLYFARKGYEVCSLELADANIKAFREKLRPDDNIELVQGNALDLGRYADGSFDIVLLFGPLYHLHSESDQRRCVAEAKRVCKDGGKLFFSFITNDMIFLTEFMYEQGYFTSGDFDKQTHRLHDFPFVFHTVPESRSLLEECGIKLLHEVAADGASELLEDKISALDDENFEAYLQYHFYICEKPEFTGMTNHLLLVGE